MLKSKNLRNNLPYRLLRLGFSCNARCLFCNVPEEDYRTSPAISLEQVKRDIDSYVKQDENTRLSLSGGEPTLRKDLAEIISWAVDKGVTTLELQTNGILLKNESTVKKLKKAGLTRLFVSLHAATADIHDTMMAKKGAFSDCVRGIRNSLNQGLIVTLNPVLTTLSYRSFPKYVIFLAKTFPEIKCISLSVVQPRGRARSYPALFPRYGAMDPFVKKGLSLAQRQGLIVNNPYCGLPLCIGGWHRYLNRCVEYCENKLKVQYSNPTHAVNGDKIKPDTCASCSLFKFCNGVWREYAFLHPLSDLKPLRNKKIQTETTGPR